MFVSAILLIDDDEDDREFFMEVIEEINPDIMCVEATNGQEGLDQLTEHGYRPDIIFLDLNMPLMNGHQFLQEVRKIKSIGNIPIVILSTSSDNNTIQETLALGASHFITKPDKFSQWKSILSEYLKNNPLTKN